MSYRAGYFTLFRTEMQAQNYPLRLCMGTEMVYIANANWTSMGLIFISPALG